MRTTAFLALASLLTDSLFKPEQQELVQSRLLTTISLKILLSSTTTCASCYTKQRHTHNAD